MKNITNALLEKGIRVIKTNLFYTGYAKTKAGTAVANEKNAKKAVYFLKLSSNDYLIPCNDKICYITTGTDYEGKIKTQSDAQKLADAGKIYSFKASDLYAEHYDFDNDKELECFFRYGYSCKTRAYIEKIMCYINLIQYTDKEDDGKQNDSIEKLCDSKWIVRTSHQASCDSFYVTENIFNRKPSNKDIETAFAIRKIESLLKLECSEVFTCWECGKTVHWTDCSGNLTEKINKLEDKYCGC